MPAKKKTNTTKSKKVKNEVKNEVKEIVKEVKEVKEEVKEEVPKNEISEIESLQNILDNIKKQISEFSNITISEFKDKQKSMTQLVKDGEKELNKIKKIYNKNNKKKTRTSTSSGFDKPVMLTDEAKLFITKHCKQNVDDSTSRKQVNGYIHGYIKDHNLQNPDNRRNILPDKHLKTILTELSTEPNKNGKIDADDGYSYFNLQKYIKHIFIKA
tara:strand:- start:25 stop:666 length:642 start_codon:yes stop_codon:yes gene_type:complete